MAPEAKNTLPQALAIQLAATHKEFGTFRFWFLYFRENLVHMQPAAEASPNFKARSAGAFYLLAIVSAVLGEFIVRGKFGLAAVVIPVSCYIAVTLFLYSLLKPVNKALSLFAACSSLSGLACEALRRQPGHINIGMVFHGLFCLISGWLIARSAFIPRILGASMALAGLIWLIYFSPLLARSLAPYNTALGLIAEAAPMLWLLATGVNPREPRRNPSLAENSRP